MPVNGFSFVSEKFFVFLFGYSDGRACTLAFARKKSGTLVPGSAFDPAPDRGQREEWPRSELLPSFASAVANRMRKPTPRCLTVESSALAPDRRKEKTARYLRSPQGVGGGF